MTYNEVKDLIDGIVIMRENVDDNLALKCKGVYPNFKSLCKKGYTAKEAGFKFQYKKELYKTMQANYTFVEHYAPGVGTESLFAKIDEAHSGTKEDPIPYSGNMELIKGKYYAQDGVIYECTAGSKQPVYHALKDLVSLYVAVVK